MEPARGGRREKEVERERIERARDEAQAQARRRAAAEQAHQGEQQRRTELAKSTRDVTSATAALLVEVEASPAAALRRLRLAP